MAGLVGALAWVCAQPAAFAQAKKKTAAPAAAAKPQPAKTAAPEAGKAGAAATPATGGEAANDQTKVKIERGAGGKKIYKIEGEIVIEGKIQKPEAFYVLQKSGINYDWHELKQDFVPKILDSVTKAPF
jgi:hypothetical protein